LLPRFFGDAFRLTLRLRDDLLGAHRRRLHHLRFADAALDFFVGARHAQRDLLVGLREHLVLALEDLLRLAHLGGYRGPELIDEVEQTPAIDDAAGADGQPARLTDLLFETVDEM
jgi:hypothetical protein